MRAPPIVNRHQTTEQEARDMAGETGLIWYSGQCSEDMNQVESPMEQVINVEQYNSEEDNQDDKGIWADGTRRI